MSRYGRNPNKAGRLGMLCVLLLLCVSCGEPSVYHQYQPVEDMTWGKEKEYFFTFRISDNSVPYNISLDIRNNSLYPYQNLWLFINREQPFGPLLKDTLECMLANDYGKWTGRGISVFESRFPIQTDYTFPIAGQYTFSFRQGMRTDSLPGIQEIGLYIEKAR